MICLTLFAALEQGGAQAQPDFPAIRLTEVTTELNLPVYGTGAGDGSGRLFIVTLDGFVTIVDKGVVKGFPFLDLGTRVTAREGEQGFYSLAFHPRYAENRRFFVSYTEIGTGDLVIYEHKVSRTDPDFAAEGTGKEIIRYTPLVPFHHGGQLAFGPDGYLYISFGDGTGPLFEPRDKFDRAQQLDSLGGKILRIDVDAATPYSVPADNPFVFMDWIHTEIYALGLRNPWKFSFDRVTGELYASDVGNYDWEEIDLIESGGNYGWPAREGPVCFVYPSNNEIAVEGCQTSQRYAPPLERYGHVAFDENGGNAIVGGYVYRGSAYPEFTGYYFYGDFTNGRIWAMRRTRYGAESKLLLDTDYPITSFVEDDAGELYMLSITGGLYRLEPSSEASP